MNFLAGAVLAAVRDSLGTQEKENAGKGEEFAFWVLDYIFRDLNWRAVYDSKFAKLNEMLRTLEAHMDEHGLQFLVEALRMHDLQLLPIFGNFFFTVGLNKLPFEMAPRILDHFLFEGEPFVFRMVLTLLVKSIAKIREFIDRPSELMDFLSSGMVPYFVDKYPDYDEILFR